MKTPLSHRKGFLELFCLADLCNLVATLCWIETQSRIHSGGTTNSDNVSESTKSSSFNERLYIFGIFEYFYFQDDIFTYLWFYLLNLSVFIAFAIVILCGISIHASTYSSRFHIKMVAFYTFVLIALFPMISFICYFKLTFFLLTSIPSSLLCFDSQSVWIPGLSYGYYKSIVEQCDQFYYQLWDFIYNYKLSHRRLQYVLSCNGSNCIYNNNNNQSHANSDVQTENNIDKIAYNYKIGIANHILCEKYAKSFWIHEQNREIADSLRLLPLYKYSSNQVHNIRKYTLFHFLSKWYVKFNETVFSLCKNW